MELKQAKFKLQPEERIGHKRELDGGWMQPYITRIIARLEVIRLTMMQN